MGRNKFPRTKPEQVALAQAMINGFTVDTADFPSPPIKASELQTKLDAAIAARNARILADAAAKEALDAEDEAYDELTDDMKEDLQYAEMVTKGDDGKMQKIGYSGRSPARLPQIPNVPRFFEILAQGKGWAKFDWKIPTGGGKVSMYRVLGQEAGGDWKELASAVKLEATVANLTTGKEYNFCVVAINQTGESGQSNTETAFV